MKEIHSEKLTKYGHHFLKLELVQHSFDPAQDRLFKVFQNEGGSRGVDLVIKTKTGKYHELLRN